MSARELKKTGDREAQCLEQVRCADLFFQFLHITVILTCFIILPEISLAYDSDQDGVDTLADAITSLHVTRLKETVHTLLVLAGTFPSQELYFSRSASGNIVTDLTTGLHWQDTSPRFKTEQEGVVYCSDFELDGYSDWRLPDFDEIQFFFKGVDKDSGFDLHYWGTFSGCTAAVAVGGYVKTPVGAQTYGGAVGDRINFSGGAAARCVRSDQ